ncbi:MAG: methyltransferase domain-containing protein [Candidatus Acidiferrales bacterium]|jgi:tocopherol O-methyltransferase
MLQQEATNRHNDKTKITKFYDFVSPHFHALWGAHLHHGYWIRGDETKELAQIQLVERLAQVAGIRPGSRILDVGCGTGASSIYLAKHYKAEVTGITISPIQVDMARKAAAAERVNATFRLMDAEAMEFENLFDIVWSIESISHYQDIGNFFGSAARLLQPGGKVAVIDWFEKANLNPSDRKKHILPIEKGMLVELRTMQQYETWMRSSGLDIVQSKIMNENCAKSWDLGLGIIKEKALWRLAAENGAMLVDFLKTFRAMKAGFESGNFVYGLIVAERM